ncbi:hydrolase [Trichuris trichiura]|uniref:Nitrilase and fragile histidine triad fusion protein NitFhit n=1 Tax=Trichuris trichiura TaxID=36087 RepID=A0A077ZHR2_TRITR|nr:hydrolase [Trichuris trichiura]
MLQPRFGAAWRFSSSKVQSLNGNEVDESKLTKYQRFKLAFKRYWYVLLPVHAVTSAIWVGSFYYLLANGFDVVGVLRSVGVSEKIVTALENTPQAGNIALAFALCKDMNVGGTRLAKSAFRFLSCCKMSEALIAVCQMRSESDKEKNWETCEYLMRRAQDRAARMVFFPECFDYMEISKRESVENALTEDGEFIGRFRSLAKELDVWVSLGGFHEKCHQDSKRVYNSHLIIDSSGNVVLKYRKLHLFDVDVPNEVSVRESDYTLPGEYIPPPVNTPVGMLSASTCYDLRFPELCRIARQRGAEILSFPSAFMVNTGMAHWEVLLRSRAIDYQCYVVAAAQFGKHNEKRSSYGHAMVVDPWGNIVSQCSNTEPSICFASIDLPFLQTVRKRLPIMNHLRQDLYCTATVCERLGKLSSCIRWAKLHFESRFVDPRLGKESYAFAEKVIPKSCVFYLTRLTYAFVNRKPVVEGHVLVAPQRCVTKLSLLDAEEVADLFMCVQRIERALEKFYGLSSSTVCIQDGPDAGQTVKHVHVHVLPRRRNDFTENDDVYVAV